MGALLGAASGLLVIKDGCHQRGILVLGLSDGGDGGMHHAQVVETASRDKLIVQTKQARLAHVIEHQVKVDDIGGLGLQLVGNKVEQCVLPLKVAVDLGQDGQHVLLLGQVVALIDRAVEVDGQM